MLMPPPEPSLRDTLFPRVERLCRHLLRDDALARDTAEDIVTDFVLLHAAKVREPQAREAYLRVVTVRRCRRLSALRGRAEALIEAPDERQSPEAQLIHADEEHRQQRRLTDCLGKLDPNARKLLRLRFHHGLTQQSIGEQLGVSKQYAGRILARALDALRTCVEAEA